MTWKILAIALLLLPIAACSPLRLLNAASSSRHYEKTFDVPYGEHPRQRLDVYLPEATARGAPVVVFFYGGGWTDGDKADYEFVASALTGAGLIVVIPDYRLFPETRFPGFIEDGAAAVSWTWRNSERLGGDPGRMFVMGHSAGAHMAALLALSGDYLPREMANALAGFIGLSGPYDFLPVRDGYLQEVFPADRREQSQPVNHVSPAAPPALLIHGTADDTVWPTNSHSLAGKLRGEGVDVTLKLYEGVGHARVVAALAPPLDFLSPTLRDSLDFVADTLGTEATRQAEIGMAAKSPAPFSAAND